MATPRLLFDAGKLIAHYRIVKCIGQGGYGDIYYVVDLMTNDPFAMKVESTKARKQALKKEIKLYTLFPDTPHFPRLVESGKHKSYIYLVMELLGPSLSTVRRSLPNSHYSLHSLYYLAAEMVKCIRSTHEAGFVHRDIKASNFLFRPNKPGGLVLVDYGLSKLIDDDEQGFKGTLQYASPDSHRGKILTRKDDMYSWFYAVTEMFGGRLPWNNIKDHRMVYKMKRHFKQTPVFLLMPKGLSELFYCIQGMEKYERPDYEYFIERLNELDEEGSFDWNNLSEEDQKRISVYRLERVGLDDKCLMFSEEELIHEQRDRGIRERNARVGQNVDRVSSVCLLL